MLVFYALRKGAGHLSSTSLRPFLPSPVGHMTDLIYAEKDLVQSLKEYILVEESKLSKIKRCPVSKVSTSTLSQASCPLGTHLGHLKRKPLREHCAAGQELPCDRP